jgi:hypothetical protein
MSPNFFLRTDQYAANLTPAIGSELADSFRAAAREMIRHRLYRYGLEPIHTKPNDWKRFRLAKSNQGKGGRRNRNSSIERADHLGRDLRIG